MKKKNSKVIYAEVKPETYKLLERLSEKYELSKNGIVALALKYLDQQKPKIEISGK